MRSRTQATGRQGENTGSPRNPCVNCDPGTTLESSSAIDRTYKAPLAAQVRATVRRDLVQIGRYLKHHQPAFAQSTVHTLYEAAESLTQFPHRGRVGREVNTRELVVALLPYVIVYRRRRRRLHRALFTEPTSSCR